MLEMLINDSLNSHQLTWHVILTVQFLRPNKVSGLVGLDSEVSLKSDRIGQAVGYLHRGMDSKSVGGLSPSLICGPVVCIYYLSVINRNNRALIAHVYL